VIIIFAGMAGLLTNQARSNKLPLVADWSPEARLISDSGENLIISLEEARDLCSDQEAIFIDSLGDMEFDYIVTLCDNARESCPFFPARIRLLHRGFDDPPVLASGITDNEMAMEHYRRVRNEIRSFVEKMPEVLVEE